ncbi:MAG: hypothetical protein QOE70_2221 [Chthoniobacter sp.]|nr:hypothetical protein [Chthoniobacter sp.]
MHPFNLASLDGANGFTINGVLANDFAGASADAGDVNGDGFGDLIVSASGVGSGPNNAGAAYVIFGKATGFDQTLELSALDGTNGFKLAAADPAKDHFFTVSGAGDVNGDGFADVIVGSSTANGLPAAPGGPAAAGAGAAWVVFGKAGPFASSVSLATLDGTTGFKFTSSKAGDFIGISVGAAGDVNGDGFGDLIIGGSLVDRSATITNSGAAYVIFGQRLAFPAVLEPPTVAGQGKGFAILGGAKSDALGESVTGAGDVNGDGFDDLIVGARNVTGGGAAYVIYGSQFRFVDVAVSTLNGAEGFKIRGGVANEQFGFTVGAGGDVNGDGFADLLIGAGGGGAPVPAKSYVLFGRAAAFGSDVNLATLNGTTGFRILGETNIDNAFEIASAGDVNGDGFDDIMVGAQLADGAFADSGAAYLIFGKASGFTANFGLSSLNGSNGVKFPALTLQDFTGASARGAGDLNGDGFDDIVFGARGADPGGRAQAGQAYVIFGSDTGAVTHPGDATANTLTGDGGANVIIGGQAGDTLLGKGGADILRGGQGDDVLAVDDLDFFRANGGLGLDTLRLDGADLALNLTTLNDFRLKSIEAIDLTGTGNNTLTLTRFDVMRLSGESNTLTVFGDAGDSVDFGPGWLRADPEMVGVTPFAVFFNGEAKLRVAPGVTTSASAGFLLGQSGDFKLTGGRAQDRAGQSVANAGDVNGDGFDDLIIGAQTAAGSGTYSGAAFVVFGKPGGFAGGLDLGALDGTNGFRIIGTAQSFSVGRSVGAAGDFNGDGFADVIVGASSSFDGGAYAGSAYVIFGKASGFGSTFDAATLNGTNGFRFTGEAANQFVGEQVGLAGDLNGDGLDDVFVGASGADLSATIKDSGAVYVIFGTRDLVNNFGPSSLALRGFTINGAAKYDRLSSGGAAGDINGDGFDDLIVGAKYADANSFDSGAAYVIYGHAGRNFPSQVTALDGTNGFRMRGENASDRLGGSVSGAGDVNGDGFADLLVGTGTFNTIYGASYLVFGKSGSFGATFDLSKLNGATGFEMNGGARQFGAGRAVAAAGDVNGDGFDDLVLGGYSASLRARYSGGTFVIYGRQGGFTATLSLGALDPQSGVVLSGEAMFDAAGFSVGGGGDFNGDGFDDVIIGAVGHASSNGVNSGAGYVFFGSDNGAVTHPGDANANTLTGDAGANVLIGGRGHDTLLGMGGADVSRGGQGDDIFGVNDLDFDGGLDFRRIAGGLGTDTLRFDGDGLSLDLRSVRDTLLQGIERIDLNTTGPNSLTLSPLEVLNLSPTSNTLTVIGDAGDTVNFGAGWTRVADTTIGGAPFQVFKSGAATLNISAAVAHPLPSGYALGAVGSLGFGFTLNGAAAGDAAGEFVTDAGDVNGDGFDDVIVGTSYSDAHGTSTGSAYVVFGKAGGFAGTIELSALAPTDGFVINGPAANSRFGNDAAGVDVNGDGFSDVIIGAYGTDVSALDAGAAYVIFGRSAPFTSPVETASLTAADGFAILGVKAGDFAGHVVRDAGDINGDGFGDLLLGADHADPGGRANAGTAYVVFGASSFPATFPLSSLNGTNGFSLGGGKAGDTLSSGLGRGGDLNGDGFSDLLFGASGADPKGSYSGESYVIFGKATPFTGIIPIVSIPGLAAGDNFGFALSFAGDVNADGLGDAVFTSLFSDASAPDAGTAYVVFGKSSGFAPNLASLGTGGFRIFGGAAGDILGQSVSSAGDVNGDGFDDLIVNADGADPFGASSGAAYVVYGKASPTDVNVAQLDGSNGFWLFGGVAGEQAGACVAAAGDVNGDGFDDVIVGSRLASPGGRLQAGQAHVVFGFDSGAVTHPGGPGDDLLTGDANVNVFVGGLGNDTIQNAGTFDVLRGGGGNDKFSIDSGPLRRLIGGHGIDTIAPTGGLLLDLTARPVVRINGFEIVDLRTGANALALDARAVVNASPDTNTLIVHANADDIVNIGKIGPGGWQTMGTEFVDGETLTVLQQGAATLKISPFFAPAVTIVNGTTATYTDVDGDLVTIKTSKGTLGATDFFLFNAGTVGGAQLATVNFADDGAEFQGSDLTITAQRTALGGDGHVNVGRIDATGVDLGKVSVAGDLGHLDAGDATRTSAGLVALNVGSIGDRGLSTQLAGGSLSIRVEGKIGALTVASDVVEAVVGTNVAAGAVGFDSINIGGSFRGDGGLYTFGSIGSVNVGQDIRGGSLAFSSTISADGDIGSITVGGSLVAGAGSGSGGIFTRGALGPTKIGGDIDGGQIVAVRAIGSLAVTGSVMDAKILAGYTTATAPANADATIGAVTVNGDWIASSLVAGVVSTDAFFGNGGETLISSGSPVAVGGDPAKIAKVASITIKGMVLGTAGGTDHFGFVAEEIGSFSVGGTKFPLTAGKSNDLAGLPVGATFDGRVREVNGIAPPLDPSSSDATFSLAELNGDNGFRFDGAEASDTAGRSVAAAGDVNDDGFDDVIVGAPGAGPAFAGEAYVIFGNANGFDASLDPADLNGSNGFRIFKSGAAPSAGGPYLGLAVGGAGDVNGDGIDDVIVGSLFFQSLTGSRQDVFVIFGRDQSTPFGASIDAATLTSSTGFLITGPLVLDTGPNPGVFNSMSVDGAGDVNGDGFDDLLIGDVNADIGGNGSGSALVVFSPGTTPPPSIDVSTLNGTTGFQMNGPNAGALLGYSVSAAGDLNGDGFDDVIAGARNALLGGFASGAAYVIFGKNTAYPANFTPADLSVTVPGFRIAAIDAGSSTAASVSGGGDLNGDSIDDIVIGAPFAGAKNPGASYVIFGRNTALNGNFAADFPLGSLNGTNGFTLTGESDYDRAGQVAMAGDVNGDGFDDLLIGANALEAVYEFRGGGYLVFGGATRPANLSLGSLDGSNGFKFLGLAAGDETGASVSGAGDVNGDGRDDIIAGAFRAAAHGTFSGSAYLVFDAVSRTVNLIDPKTATFTDVDGDLVTIKTSKGAFVADDFTVKLRGPFGGAQLQLLDLSGPAHAAFAGADLTITAVRGASGGDGFVNVGALITDHDLGKIAIDGDLGQLDAGDGTPLKQAIASLTVQSLGRLGLSTQAAAGASLESNIKGKLGALTVKSDIVGAFVNIDGSTDDGDDAAGAITVGGSLRGGALANSGRIFAAGDLGVVKISQSILGGAGPHSGSLEAGGKIAGVTLGGSLRGGAGPGSGSLIAGATLGATAIGGDVNGGRIFVRGNLAPGSDALALAIKTLTVGGNVFNADLFAGYDRNGDPANGDVQIGAVKVGRDWIDSDLVAGVKTGADGFFGNGDEPIPGPLISRIASIVISGQALGSIAPGDHFGFVAEEIGSFAIGATKFPLTAGPGSDSPGLPVGATGDLRVRE